jgi:hypothetical protein
MLKLVSFYHVSLLYTFFKLTLSRFSFPFKKKAYSCSVLCFFEFLRKQFRTLDNWYRFFKKSSSHFTSTQIVLAFFFSFLLLICFGKSKRVHTEWQWPLSGVHSTMMEKLALPGEGEGCTHTPFHCIYHNHTITYKVLVYVYAPAETAGTLPLFLYSPLYMYSVVKALETSVSQSSCTVWPVDFTDL